MSVQGHYINKDKYISFSIKTYICDSYLKETFSSDCPVETLFHIFIFMDINDGTFMLNFVFPILAYTCSRCDMNTLTEEYVNNLSLKDTVVSYYQ